MSEIVANVPTEGTGSPTMVAADRRKVLTDKQIRAIVESYVAGSSTVELAETYGVHRYSVERHLRAAGIGLRQWQRLSDPEALEAQRRYEAGESISALADHFGVDRETIRVRLVKLDVVIRPYRAGLSPEQLADAVRLYEGGSALRTIAAGFHVGSPTGACRGCRGCQCGEARPPEVSDLLPVVSGL